MNRQRCDVAIVGSGAGGGTVAAALAPLVARGKRVLVLERGPRFLEEDFTGRELDMAPALYAHEGGFLTADGTMTLAFGRGYGGSTIVYTGTSLIAPRRVIEQWRVPGLDHADVDRRSRKYMEQNGVHLLPPVLVNENNHLFAAGAAAAGYHAEQFPLNLRGCRGSSLCNLGCPNAAKQGTNRVQLPAAERMGVEVVTRATVTRLGERRLRVTVAPRPQGAKGADPEWEPGDYEVSADTVVLAGGVMGTVPLLLGSGLPGLPAGIGAGFTCHPAHILVAEHPRPITNDVGHPKSFFVDRSEAEGYVLESCMYFPFVTAKNMTGFGAGHSAFMQAFPRLQMILVLACDKAVAENRVAIDRRGEPVVHYRFTDGVIDSMVRATRAAARIFFAAGAVRVHAPSAEPQTLEAREAGQIDRRIDARHFRTGTISISAAHLMGGASMGRSPTDAVTDAWGRVHGTPWLRVADASLFPDSLEINPYLTIMALADRVAEGILEDLAPMKLTGGAIVVRALADEGVRFAFGIPGTHNIELYDAFGDSDLVRPILITDEQSAGFMADGLWRATGELGCVNIVPGAGLTHALSGIAEAFMDCVPMLVLGCGIRRATTHAFQLHDIDQLAIVAPVVKATFRPEGGADLYRTIREACALARSGSPGPVMVEVSIDLYLARHEVQESLWGAPAGPPAPRAGREQVSRAAALLSAHGVKPLLYAGLGAQGATAELLALAERLEAPVATTIQGKGVFPESHPLFLWNGFGASAPPFARDIAKQRDLTLAIGCRFSEVGTGSYGFTPPGPLIHVDINEAVLGKNFPPALGIAADARTFLVELLNELSGQYTVRAVVPQDPGLRTSIREGHEGVRAEWLRSRSVDRVTPFVLLDALQREFGPETVFTADSGNGTFLAMECLRLERPGRFLAPVDYSCMGYSVPAAIGAALGKPGAPVIALAGDGAFLMTGLELLTAASQHVPLAVFVLRDRELAQIAQFQSTAFNRTVASTLPDYHLGSIAEAVGVEWLSLDTDADVIEVVRAAKATMQAGRPVLVDVAIDYSNKTWFTRGVVRTMLNRLSWPERVRFVGRALGRKLKGG